MTRVQEYLRNKKIKEDGLPKIWVVKSDRTGVEKPVEHQVTEIRRCVSKRITPKPELDIHRYMIDVSPYEIDIEEGATSGKKDGMASGFGDLWHWSYFSTFSKEEADKFYSEELKRVTNKYLKNKQ